MSVSAVHISKPKSIEFHETLFDWGIEIAESDIKS